MLLAAGPAAAAPLPPRYAAWTFAGTTTAYAGTVDLGAGFPGIAFTSDSRTPPGASVGDPGGAISTSAVIRADSAFGALYGISQGQQYVNLRPRADGNAASAGMPSTTTYTFASPSPVGTWGAVLGDIDAETLTISATGTDGGAVSGSALGVTALNYCGTPANATCAAGQATPVPVVMTAATTVSADDPLCPPTDCNTSGEAVSVQPTVALRSLTVASSWKQGFPSYQTWFATRTATLTGHVVAPCALPAAPNVQLLDAAGTVVATSGSDAAGDYGFTGVAASADYRIRLDPADVPTNASAPTVAVGAAVGDTAVPDITVTTTATVTGAVKAAAAGSPSTAGLPVSLRAGALGGGVRYTTTGNDGTYEFAPVAPGDYTVTVTPANSDSVDPISRAVTVGCAAATVPDFVVTAAASATSPAPPASTPPASSTTTPTTGTPGQVSSSTGGSPDAGGGSLAATGADVRWLALAGALLVTVGAIVAVRGRSGALHHR